MDYKMYMDFVLAMENKEQPRSLAFFFRLVESWLIGCLIYIHPWLCLTLGSNLHIYLIKIIFPESSTFGTKGFWTPSTSISSFVKFKSS